MIRRTLALSFAIAAPTLVGLSGCATFSRGDAKSLSQVEVLAQEIQTLHVESELSKDAMRGALVSLKNLVSVQPGQDHLLAYEEFIAAIERSEEQAERLDDSVGPMRRSAEAVFADWAADLESFARPDMRQRSQARLAGTQQRYQAILAAVEPAVQAYETLNTDLRDHAMFLEHDFNAAAIAEISSDVQALASRAMVLDGVLDQCLVSARQYISSTALHVEGPADTAPETSPR